MQFDLKKLKFRPIRQRLIKISRIIAFSALVALVMPLSYSAAGNPRLFRIGTGGQTGVYYPIGKIIAQGLTHKPSAHESAQPGKNGVPGYIGVAQNSAGSIENVRSVASGAIEAGLVQADVAAWAFQSKHVFKDDNNVRDIRAVASLYPEKFQMVTRRDADIRSVNEMRGKRISVDEIGSGTLAVMRIVLKAHNMTENDLRPVYLKPVFTHDRMVSGDLQGFVMMAGAPMAAVTQLSSVGISLVPISPKIAARIQARYAYLVPSKIPADIYPGIPETPTVQVYALMVVSAKTDAQLVYNVTAALWSDRTLAMLKTGHSQGKSITPETASEGISIPLHPGAKKYYQEHGKRFKGSESK